MNGHGNDHMKVCMLVEGSYPFITGGVSSWVHSLIQWMPEHQFTIYAIGAQEKIKDRFNYSLPANVDQVNQVFLDAYIKEESNWGKRYRLSQDEREALLALLIGEEIDWERLFFFFQSNRLTTVSEFLTSKDYFDIVQMACEKKYTEVPFTEMFWTVRSMLLPLFILIRKEMPKADLYHSVSTGYAGVIGGLAKYLYKRPLILTEHGIYTREREEEIIKASWVKSYLKDLWIDHFYALSSCAYGYADEVITLFHRNKEMQIELGCAPEKISIIPNGIPTDDYLRLPSTSRDQTIVNIGAIVRVVPIKDIKTMLQSFALVREQFASVKFYIFGSADEDEEYYEECLQLVQALALEKEVSFMGNVNLKDHIGSMDMFVLSSISEGMPLAILEGFAAGKPFISTDVGCCKELIYGYDDEYGQAGFVLPIMHYEEIGEAILTLCKNESIRLEMGKRGQKRVQAHYTRERVVEGYKSIYNRTGSV